MKYGVIDVGSNSVRLMISDGVKTFYKKVKTTRLADGMSNGLLKREPIDRTAKAVVDFCDKAKTEKVDIIYCFATAAVRNAANKQEFVTTVKMLCGVDVDVVSGKTEAELGILGALNGGNGGIIDVGGASSEIAVVNAGAIIYSQSINIGAVSLKNICGQDKALAEQYISNQLLECGEVPLCRFFSIGGTATTIAAMAQELALYDPKKVDGYKIDFHFLSELVDKLYNLSVEERKKLKGLQPERAEVIACGALVLKEIIKKVGINYIIVSEKDNLEGYLIKKLEQK